MLWGLSVFGEFMESIDTVIDVGCGNGHDALWWANATDGNEEDPLNLGINVIGLDIKDRIDPTLKIPSNLTFKFENWNIVKFKKQFDVVWTHNTIQETQDPLKFLHKMNEFCADGGMLALSFPTTSNMFYGDPDYRIYQQAPHSITMIHLIYMLVLSGFNCNEGFFTKQPGTNIISAIVYKDTDEVYAHGERPLADFIDLLPDSCKEQLKKYNYLTNKNLLLRWLDYQTLDYSTF